jgi:D-alanyl-D-alanine carboxypeptidase (penicillin-binding protein 5/6)
MRAPLRCGGARGSAVLVRFTFALIAALSLSGTALGAENFQSAAPEALLIDYESGATLFEKNADATFPAAALVKLMTAELIFRELKAGRLTLDGTFTVSEHAWRTGGGHAHATASFLDVHSAVRIEDLLRGLIVQSGNDAAITLAEGLAGSEEAFADLMNKRAAELGLQHSFFVDPSGRDEPRQRVTARDMALLAADIIREYPDYYHYFAEKDFTWNKIHQMNRNPLLGAITGADGLKTGDDAAGEFSLVGSAVDDGQRLIVVIAGVKTAAERGEEARKLLDWGFRSFEPRVLYHAGTVVGSASVYGGASGDVPLVCDTEIKVFLARGDQEHLTAKIVYLGPLAAPVEADAQVATLRIWRGATLVLEAPLRTQTSVPVGGLAKRAFDAGIEFAAGLIRNVMAKN